MSGLEGLHRMYVSTSSDLLDKCAASEWRSLTQRFGGNELSNLADDSKCFILELIWIHCGVEYNFEDKILEMSLRQVTLLPGPVGAQDYSPLCCERP